MNKKVLIVTYYWPPSSGSGVQRWLKFAKYLPENGWDTFVYTPENPTFDILDKDLSSDLPSGIKVVKRKIFEPYKLLSLFGKKKNLNTGLVSGKKKKTLKNSLINWVRGNMLIPDPRKFWVRPSVNYLSKLIQEEGIEVVITTGPPHSMHLIGRGLKSKTSVKWVADFRDPFSKLDFLDTYSISPKNRQKYYDLESDILANADIILATSYSMSEMLMPFDHSKFHTVTNGYDPSDFEGIQNQKKDDVFRIYHAGLLNEVRNPKNLWESIKDLRREMPQRFAKFEIHLAGIIDENIQKELLDDPELKDLVRIEGYKNHSDVIKDYFQSDLLLLLINNTDNTKVNIPGKLFEYLYTGKNILALGDKNADAVHLLEEAGHHLNADYDDRKGIKELLKMALSDKDEPGQKKNSNQFSRKSLTKDLNELLTQLIDYESQ